MILLMPLMVITLATTAPAPAGANRERLAPPHLERPVSVGARHAPSEPRAQTPPLNSQ